MFGSGLAENVLVWRTEEGDVRKSGLGNYTSKECTAREWPKSHNGI
jgi:hypothetical protein